MIRTLDLGADKMAHLPEPEDERNPVLGLRSIRLALRNLPLTGGAEMDGPAVSPSTDEDNAL